MNFKSVNIGLYRRYDGGYYYVTGVTACNGFPNLGNLVQYFDVCNPELGNFSMTVFDFTSTYSESIVSGTGALKYSGTKIADREDNVTGQIHRFERVKDLNWQISSVSTEQLIKELQSRSDSPIHELDLEGLKSKVFSHDYVVGVPYDGEDDVPMGVDIRAIFDNEYDARRSIENNARGLRVKLFKRTFIEVD